MEWSMYIKLIIILLIGHYYSVTCKIITLLPAKKYCKSHLKKIEKWYILLVQQLLDNGSCHSQSGNNYFSDSSGYVHSNLATVLYHAFTSIAYGRYAYCRCYLILLSNRILIVQSFRKLFASLF